MLRWYQDASLMMFLFVNTVVGEEPLAVGMLTLVCEGSNALQKCGPVEKRCLL